MVIVHRKQTSDLGESLNHIFVRVKDVFSNPFRNSDFLRVAPVIVHGRKEGKSVFQSDLVILLAVTRRRVHATGAGVERDVLAQQNDRVTIQEWMAAEPFLHLSARKNSERFADRLPAGFLFEMTHQLSRHEQDPWFGRARDDEIPEPDTCKRDGP